METLAALMIQVGVVLAVSGPISPGEKSALMAETAAVWESYGVRLIWFDRDEDCGSAPLTGAALPVDIVLYLDADADKERSGAAGRRPLGFVRFAAGVPGRTVHIRYGSLERLVLDATLGNTLVRCLPIPLRDRLVGRALGRVLSHELGHVLLASPSHSSAGLMRPTFGPDDLLAAPREHLRLTQWAISRLPYSHMGNR